MSAYDVLLSALTAEVAALVPESRIQRHYVRQDVARPAISYRRTAQEYVEVIHGAPLAANVTFDITCIADSEESVEALGDAVERIGNVESIRLLTREDLADPETEEFATVVTVVVFQGVSL